MLISLFGVRYQRGQDVDWYDNPHTAISRCRDIKARKIVWLCYDTEHVHPHYDSKAWQSVWNLADFERRVMPRLAPADSRVSS